ncbi:MAG: class I SAM-dependent methyltransferase [Betaproteobacteria bacterium]
MNFRECRFCHAPLEATFADLGMSPISNAFLKREQLNSKESFYPLHAYVCGNCMLVQIEAVEKADHIFNEGYAYFSSFSDSWLEHSRNYVEHMTGRFGYGPSSFVVEIASNDGYLLQYFAQNKIRVLGVEPTANTAEAARKKGVDTLVKFFGVGTAKEIAANNGQADLLLGNNVLAHVPDLNDFVAGMKILLKAGGVITLEFPHLLRLMQENQFDTIYHEHFSYFSFLTVERVFAKHRLTLFDVQQLKTHGGSLRIFARHADDAVKPVTPAVASLLADERKAGLDTLAAYADFAEKVRVTKRKLLQFLIQAKGAGKTVVGYGAPAKGNTLLNYCGVRSDFIDYTVDRSPHKQGMFLPGTHIPIYGPERIKQTRPDYVLILPWNIKEEIIQQVSEIRSWGGKFVVPIPEVTVIT